MFDIHYVQLMRACVCVCVWGGGGTKIKLAAVIAFSFTVHTVLVLCKMMLKCMSHALCLLSGEGGGVAGEGGAWQVREGRGR